MRDATPALNGYRIQSIVLLGLFITAYWVPLYAMASTWYHNPDYSYGFIIPVISGYLLWLRRKEFNLVPVGSSFTVLPLLIGFVTLSVYGILGSSGNISMPATPILFLLFFTFCFGIPAARRFFLPLSFLVFMVPVPAVLERTIGVFLKSISSEVGGQLIRLAGQPVHVSGNIIDLGVTQLQVVDACSGLRYIFPLFALGILYAYFFEKVAWKKTVCVLATIPIAILTNALRIAVTGLLIPVFGVSVAEGFFHDFSGWLIFLAAFAMLSLFGRLLRLLPPRGVKENQPVSEDIVQGRVSRADTKPAFLISCGLMAVVAAVHLSTGSLPPVRIQGGLTAFPLTFGSWTGASQPIDAELVQQSGAEESFSGNYRHSELRGEVSLYIGYRSSAFLANENFFHSPTVCLPAAGYSVKAISTHTIHDVPHFNDLTVSTMLIEHLGTRQLVYYWFQTKDRSSPDKNINRFHLALHAIKRDNTHDLFIRPISGVAPGETIEAVEQRLDGFVREMISALFRFLAENQIQGNSF